MDCLALFTARKRSLRRLCFYRCLSVHTGGGVHGCSQGGAYVVAPRGHAWLLQGGMCGCSGGACVVAMGGMHGCSRGCVWLLPGGWGHAWLLLGGACMVFSGGHAWFLAGGRACMVFWGGMHGFFWGGMHRI